MPRSVRVEFAGAFYHVMCRGDRREPIFLGDQDRELFLTTLGQTCRRHGFVLHADVLMCNHYHFLLETPVGQLVAGMRWFQTTYTARFNARHRLSGHLFQGRYKALLVDPDSSGYGRTVADYIHLNPVRAGLAEDEDALRVFPWCSYRYYVRPGGAPGWLQLAAIDGDHGLSPRRVADRRHFRKHMAEWIAQERRRRPAEADPWEALRRGWVLGSEAFRERMEDLASIRVHKRRRESYHADGLARHDQRQARALLERALTKLRIELEALRTLRQNDVRKQAVGWLLKSRTASDNRWITETLNMGDRSNLNRAVRRFEAASDHETDHWKQLLHQCRTDPNGAKLRAIMDGVHSVETMIGRGSEGIAVQEGRREQHRGECEIEAPSASRTRSCLDGHAPE